MLQVSVGGGTCSVWSTLASSAIGEGRPVRTVRKGDRDFDLSSMQVPSCMIQFCQVQQRVNAARKEMAFPEASGE